MSDFACEMLEAPLDFSLSLKQEVPPLSNSLGDTDEGAIFPGQCHSTGKEEKEKGVYV